MNEDIKIRGIVSVFKKLVDEQGGEASLDEDALEELKDKVARRMDFLFNPTWRLEVLLNHTKGSDPFGGGWLPEPPLPSTITPSDVDEMYRRMRSFAKNREMSRERLEHMPEEMDHSKYEKIKPKSKMIIAVMSCPKCQNRKCGC